MSRIREGTRVKITKTDANLARVTEGDVGIVTEFLESGNLAVRMADGKEWYISPAFLKPAPLGKVKTYREEVLRTAVRDMAPVHHRFAQGNNALLTNAGAGLANEGGEFNDLVKKYIFHGAPIDRDKAIKELGDIRWYLECAAHCLGVTMDEIESGNVEKLRARYPEGFSESAAAARADTKKKSA